LSTKCINIYFGRRAVTNLLGWSTGDGRRQSGQPYIYIYIYIYFGRAVTNLAGRSVTVDVARINRYQYIYFGRALTNLVGRPVMVGVGQVNQLTYLIIFGGAVTNFNHFYRPAPGAGQRQSGSADTAVCSRDGPTGITPIGMDYVSIQFVGFQPTSMILYLLVQRVGTARLRQYTKGSRVSGRQAWRT
jgi:hypothetical protein